MSVMAAKQTTVTGPGHEPRHAVCVRNPAMQIQIRHDDNISGGERLDTIATASVEAALGRFATQISRVEVHVADENGAKSGGDDVRCTIQVSIQGRPPAAATHHASELEVAIDGAAEKVARVLDHELGRLRDTSDR